MQSGIPYVPDLDAFSQVNVDIYTNSGHLPPLGGDLRVGSVSASICAAFSEASRSRISPAFAYTHVLIVDTNTEIRDYYRGNSAAVGGSDILGIPAGTTTNFWYVVHCFVAGLPGVGRKKVILADRQSTPDWVTNP